MKLWRSLNRRGKANTIICQVVLIVSILNIFIDGMLPILLVTMVFFVAWGVFLIVYNHREMKRILAAAAEARAEIRRLDGIVSEEIDKCS